VSRIESNRGKELSDLLDEAEVLLEGADHAARSHWPILLIKGIALALFGVLALFIPPLITVGICIISRLGVSLWRDCRAVSILPTVSDARISPAPFLGRIEYDRRICSLGKASERHHLAHGNPHSHFCLGRRGKTNLSIRAASLFLKLSDVDKGKRGNRSRSDRTDVRRPSRNRDMGSRTPLGGRHDSRRYCSGRDRAAGTAEASYEAG